MLRAAFLLAVLTAPAIPLRAGPAVQPTPVAAPGPNGPLSGTMLRADGGEGAATAALIIPGSGPTDRDGNNPLGVRAGTYRLLAEGLAAQGITTVRADKRGMFGSVGAVADPNAVTIADYVADTQAWIAAIRAQTGASCVWLIGHSEGGLVALAAAQSARDLCGVVLIATAGRPLGEVIKTQLRANPANAPLLEAAEAAIDQLASGEKVDASALPGPLAGLFNPAVQDFLISAFALDPAQLAAGTRLPMLIVQGGQDLQVPIADAERLKAANPAATLALLPSANHVLKNVPDDDPATNIAAYGNPALPLAEGLVAQIAAFMSR